MATSLARGFRLFARLPLRTRPATSNVYIRSLSLRQLSTATAAAQRTLPALASESAVAGVTTPVTAAEPVEDAVDERATFSSLDGKVSRQTLSSIQRNPKLTHMTAVQEAVFAHLPHIARDVQKGEDGELEKSVGPRDLMVRAKTGTGKTLAFLVPAIEHRLNQIAQAEGSKGYSTRSSRRDSPPHNSFARRNVGALILSPTRELASQIANEAKRMTAPLGFEVHELLGGLPKGAQIRRWRGERRDIVVATTGRLRDLMESVPDFKDSLSTSKMLILDEADTMLDMGFREDIEAITQDLPPAPERQTFVFSATISKSIQQVAREVLDKNHAYLNCVSEEGSPVHEHIPQFHTVLPSASEQINHILRLISHDQLSNPGKSKIIVFLPTTKLTQFFARVLRESKQYMPAGRMTSVHELHSKLSMNARTRTSASFRKDSKGASILVTSDVSARGVDYPGVTRVIQVGVPSSPDQYVHRVGRTGRTGGTQGRGDLVLLPWEQGFLQASLSDMPLKPVTVDDLKSSTLELAARHDADPQSFFPTPVSASDERQTFEKFDKRGRRSSMSSFDRPIPSLAKFDNRVSDRLASLSDEGRNVAKEAYELDGDQYFTEVEEVFGSLLGYYVSRATDMRTRRDAILTGLKTWATDCAGMERPPSVSSAFLKKIGYGDESPQPRSQSRNRSYGSGGSFGGNRSRSASRSSDYGGFQDRPRRSFESDKFQDRPRKSGWDRDASFSKKPSYGQDRDSGFSRRPSGEHSRPWEGRGRSAGRSSEGSYSRKERFD